MCCITFWQALWFKKKKNSKYAPGVPGHELDDHWEGIMPIPEGHAKVTDWAGPAGPEPDHLYIVSITSFSLFVCLVVCLSEPADLGLTGCRLMVGRRCELRKRETVFTQQVFCHAVNCVEVNHYSWLEVQLNLMIHPQRLNKNVQRYTLLMLFG